MSQIKCWSDSQVALCWLKGKNKCWKPWVENRVVKVRKVVKSDDWSFISGKENPADIPTRVCDVSDFDRWFRGPEFLYNDGFERDSFDVESRLVDADVLVESRKHTNVSTSLVENDINFPNISSVMKVERFGSLNKLLNATAYVLRFINIMKKRVPRIDNYVPTSEDRQSAMDQWLMAEQHHLRKQQKFG